VTDPDALDQSWSFADPATCARLGIKLVSMYLSHDESKNSTPFRVKAYHRAGIAVQHNWESTARRALEGFDAGVADGEVARAQLNSIIAGVGYRPHNKLAIAFSVDVDTTPADYPHIDAYFHGVRTALQGVYLTGAYGEADVIEHLHTTGLTDMEWQTIAWSNGRVSPEADLYQFRLDQTFAGASVDFNKIIHGSLLGAWWPPGVEAPLGGGTEIKEDDMPTADEIVDALMAYKRWPDNDSTPLWRVIKDIQKSAHSAADASHIAEAVLAKLPATGGAAITMAEIETAVKNVLRSGVGQ